MLSRLKAFAVLATVFVASVAVGVARPAAAETPLPVSVGDMVVDNAHQQVFVSSPAADTVTVLDFDGRVVKTLSGLAQAGSMLLDGSTLFVVLSGAGTVDAYDTTTFERLGRFGAGTLVKPGPLAMAGGKLWTSTGECGGWYTKLASIDVSSGAVQVHDVPRMLDYCIGLADGPNDTDTLLAWTYGLSPTTMFRLDVSSGTPAVVAERRQAISYTEQLVLAPDGTRFVAVPGTAYGTDQFRLSDLAPDGVMYTTNPYPNAVAVTGARGGLVAVGQDSAYHEDIDMFVLGDPSRRIFSHDFDSTSDTLWARGLAFSGDGRRLFAVRRDSATNASQFHVFAVPSPTATTTTTAPPTTSTTTRPTTTTTAPLPSAPPGPSPVDPPLPGAGPGGPGLASAGSVTDARGDVIGDDGTTVTEPRADIVAAGATRQEGRIVLTMQLAEPISPLDDRNWDEGSSFAAWGLDGGRDGTVDRLAVLVSAGGALHGVVSDVSDPPSLLCEAAASAAGGTLTMSFDASCLGASSFDWGAFLLYNRGGAAADGPYLLDVVPDETPQADPPMSTAGAGGYWMISQTGDVYAFGDAPHFGNQPTAAADIEPTPTAGGYWVLSRTGRVHAKGDAPQLGDAALAPGEQAVSLSATPSGRGYWVFTDKGRAFNFGDAAHHGDMAGVPLNGPVLGSVATPTGRGYWMVASDGGIFAFGDAVFSGSMGGRRLNRPVMSMAPDPDGSGYWLVASDGGIFAFDAPFYGSTGNLRLNRPISGMVPGKAGYLMVAEDGGIFAFGDVPFHGSLGANPPPQPIVAVALLPTR
jgi:hypothetical protein